MAVSPPVCDFGAMMPDFALPDPDGRMHLLDEIAGARGTLVMFICNHCPYVQAIADRIRRDAADLQKHGIGVVAISANDVAEYPQDAPAQMKIEAVGTVSPFPIFTTKPRQLRGPMAPNVLRISLATMQTANCSIAGGWTRPGAARALRMHDANCTKLWCRSPKPGRVRASRFPRWDVRSNGRPE